ncbi:MULTISPECIES: hypothetical protein [unclassified Shewanella]|uniref:hypothetical protein n=1 Tax=unclassified Shewanella TaxID=196818 RepID=UPI0021D94A4D|nr:MULTISPECIES: hypothetical protein [unclassified Shewanella]MCU8043321.1 hypothetical protein [Shewanella sp. SM68]MCU8047695.1 hypothetical protein [Shewanella sp. SM65]
MLTENDHETIIQVMYEMMNEQLTQPLTGLLDSLYFNLLSQNAIEPGLLERQLSSLIDSLEDHQIGNMGHRLLERYRLLSQKAESGALLELFQKAQDSEITPKPTWFQGVIQGGLEEHDS